MTNLTGYPIDHGWLPHRPETWDKRFARLRKKVTMRFYKGYWDDDGPVMEETEFEAGTRVKIVMVSRLGDVGVTPNLDADHGYGARVMLDELDFSDEQ